MYLFLSVGSLSGFLAQIMVDCRVSECVRGVSNMVFVVAQKYGLGLATKPILRPIPNGLRSFLMNWVMPPSDLGKSTKT